MVKFDLRTKRWHFYLKLRGKNEKHGYYHTKEEAEVAFVWWLIGSVDGILDVPDSYKKKHH